MDAVADGVPQRFLPLPPPSADEVARVLAGTARRITRLIEARIEVDEDALARDEPLLATLAAASLRTRIATGPHTGERWRRLGDRVEPREDDADPEASPRVPQHAGMSLHADVAVPARDRRRLERLCRYVARPPLATDRLEELPDARLARRLKTPWRDGTTHILMERHELLDRLVPLIPPPRAHKVRYHGVLAPCASARDRVVPIPARGSPPESGHGVEAGRALPGTLPTHTEAWERARADPPIVARSGEPMADSTGQPPSAPKAPSSDHAEVSDRSETRPAAARSRPRRFSWAELLQRVFEVDALRCPRCGSRMRLLAVTARVRMRRRLRRRRRGRRDSAQDPRLPRPARPGTTDGTTAGRVGRTRERLLGGSLLVLRSEPT